MPCYEYHCTAGHYFERTLPVSDYQSQQKCACGAFGRRIISLPTLKIPQDIRYDSPIDGRPITSERARRNDLARSGCQPYDPEMKKDVDRYHKQEAEKIDRALDETMEREFEALPSVKKEKLANELLGGAEVTTSRHNVAAKPIVTEIKHHGR